MGLTALRQILGRVRGEPAGDAPAQRVAAAPVTSAPPPSASGVEAHRLPPMLALRHELCGEGFLFPDGEGEVLRLARPLGLSEAASVALLGAGSGGPVAAIAAAFGAWVSGYEADPALLPIAEEHCRHSGQGKRATVAAWEPARPALPRAHFHHALSLYALAGTAPRTVLSALAQALRPRGQLVLIDLVATPDAPADADFANWARLEERPPLLPSETEITRLLGELGCDVRVAEDVSERHIEAVIHAWRTLIRPMASARPTLARAKLLVTEAERWLLRVRLLQAGRLRLVRWHALTAAKTLPLA